MSEANYAEQRQHPRFRPDRLRSDLGDVVDLSRSGARVLVRQEIEGSVPLTLHTTNQGPIAVHGRVQWRRALGGREFMVGLAFEQVDAAARPALDQLVSDVAQGVSQAGGPGSGVPTRGRAGRGLVLLGLLVVVGGGALLTHETWAPVLVPALSEHLSLAPPLTAWACFLIGALLVIVGLTEWVAPPARRDATGPGHETAAAAAGLAVMPAAGGGTAAPPATAAGAAGPGARTMSTEHLLNCILESSLGGVSVLKAVRSEDRRVVDFEVQLINRAAENLLGKSEVMVIGHRLSQVFPCLMNHAIFNDLSSTVLTGLPVQQQYRLDNGRWVQLAVVQLGDGLAVTFADTTEQHHAQARLRHVAYHDELTGLPNRKMLMEHLEKAMNRARRFPERKLAVLFLDFDRFKIVNDTLGHDIGDLLLNSISGRLRENIRSVDVAGPGRANGGAGGGFAAQEGVNHMSARLGGDEFVVMLDGLESGEDALKIADRLLKTFNEPHMLDGHRVVSTASIGIVLSGDGHETVDELLRDADTAMYQAKHTGKGRYVVFDRQMHETLVAQAQLENDLRDAVKAEDFTLVYEPIVEVETGRVVGFETLIRWDHKTRGRVSPEEFVPLAEELNLIVPVGAWVIRQSCTQLARWKAAGDEDAFLNINLSRAQLYDGDLVNLLAHEIMTHGLDPSRIRLEITETMVMNDVGEMRAKLVELKELGVRLALDDFGTGHSSLNVLQELPLDILKIDRSFIANAGDAVRRYGAIIATITELARNLDMQVIAEGIERQEQVDLLRSLHCDHAQGWLYSRAIDADEAAAMIVMRPELGHDTGASPDATGMHDPAASGRLEPLSMADDGDVPEAA